MRWLQRLYRWWVGERAIEPLTDPEAIEWHKASEGPR